MISTANCLDRPSRRGARHPGGWEACRWPEITYRRSWRKPGGQQQRHHPVSLSCCQKYAKGEGRQERGRNDQECTHPHPTHQAFTQTVTATRLVSAAPKRPFVGITRVRTGSYCIDVNVMNVRSTEGGASRGRQLTLFPCLRRKATSQQSTRRVPENLPELHRP